MARRITPGPSQDRRGQESSEGWYVRRPGRRAGDSTQTADQGRFVRVQRALAVTSLWSTARLEVPPPAWLALVMLCVVPVIACCAEQRCRDKPGPLPAKSTVTSASCPLPAGPGVTAHCVAMKPPSHDDEQPTYSSLDEVTSTTAELLSRPAKPPTTAIEPPSSGRWLVVGVHDGDTVLCLDQDNTQHKIRLVGIDAPETGQA
jgi:hypothetical protein